MDIRTVNEDDASAIAKLYNYYINETIITFEETAVTAEQMLERIRKIQHAQYPWLVVEINGNIISPNIAKTMRKTKDQQLLWLKDR
ncbi:GNAT family N-acetyltransferase [Photobacterium leiognathi]|uniref:GNAT family N-acetyltransferase n=1 Tax=Photobacterium leiognathi TaxID=553611 RepID=UPI00298172B2|nr:GNAT family N-acetyltransferase [Photobacterium leiognathi]